MRAKVLCDDVGWEFKYDHTQSEKSLTSINLSQGDSDIFRKVVCLGIAQIRSVLDFCQPSLT